MFPSLRNNHSLASNDCSILEVFDPDMPLILDSPPLSPRHFQKAAKAIPLDAAAQRRNDHHESDVVIVGAGILGCALAVTFARQGRSVVLLEKNLREPDRIVGELLQPGGVEALRKLGLINCLDGIDATVVEGYEVIYYGVGVQIPYPENSVEQPRDKQNQHSTGDKKRPEGRSFHHGRFIQKLRDAAMHEPNISLVESTVTGTVKNEWTNQVLGVECTTQAEPDAWFGQLTVLADGYASRFRKEYISHAPTSKSKFWGLELIDANLPRKRHGHVVLGDGAPILLYQIGSRETRALVDVPEGIDSARPAKGGVKAHLRNEVLPGLPSCVQPSFSRALDNGKLRSMPNSFLPPSTNRTPGIVLLGDAMNMRHPLTGGGMTVAFNDVVLLRELLDPCIVPDLGNTRLVRQQMKSFHWRRKNLTSVINILAQALYSLFAANDPQLKALQRGCFSYFQRGGQCIDGPVGLLAGIIRQPLVLFYHFFAVALLGIWLVWADSPLWALPMTVLSSIGIFWKACVVIFPFIFSEIRS